MNYWSILCSFFRWLCELFAHLLVFFNLLLVKGYAAVILDSGMIKLDSCCLLMFVINMKIEARDDFGWLVMIAKMIATFYQILSVWGLLCRLKYVRMNLFDSVIFQLMVWLAKVCLLCFVNSCLVFFFFFHLSCEQLHILLAFFIFLWWKDMFKRC